ncbi:hypothetical protein GRJ2_001404600 [Grus japonensis]|uniref:Uncharacterized protein n=1 Tax=Grus japonensis TaxID=30415 RepID=A0ABC9WVB3_GRUJA
MAATSAIVCLQRMAESETSCTVEITAKYLPSTNTQTENRASLMSQKEGSQLDAHTAASELQPSEGNLQNTSCEADSLIGTQG